MQGNGLFIVGQTKTMACYITSAETVSSFPLAWSTGGSTLIASQEQTINVAGNVKNYNSFYRLTVSASDNLDIYTCTATLPSGTTSATWTVYVYSEFVYLSLSICYIRVSISFCLCPCFDLFLSLSVFRSLSVSVRVSISFCLCPCFGLHL